MGPYNDLDSPELRDLDVTVSVQMTVRVQASQPQESWYPAIDAVTSALAAAADCEALEQGARSVLETAADPMVLGVEEGACVVEA
ncbi:MAG: hypothetical protein JXQ73_25130 [Phycisphaerae bacterium]|nr:hypothetical protein [Phycisphaerae bacterium]